MDNTTLNSCLMLAINLNTPVNLACLFDSSDLKDTGIEVESHITILYAQGKEIPDDELLQDIKDILGESDYTWLKNMIEGDESYQVLDSFELDLFQNDSDYLILKLKKGTELYRLLRLVNKSLALKYGVKSEFNEYIPHLSLAELKPGTGKKYLNSATIREVLGDSIYELEDLFISWGPSGEPEDRKYKYLTSYKCIPRFFRLLGLKKEIEEL